MVPRVGIEPTLLAEPDFESGASTNFTTEALPPAGRRARRIIADLNRSGNPGAVARVELRSDLLHVLTAIDCDVCAGHECRLF